jgi:hypothetical protein
MPFATQQASLEGALALLGTAATNELNMAAPLLPFPATNQQANVSGTSDFALGRRASPPAPRESGRKGEPHKHIWPLDCIAICTVLGLALNDKQIGKLCRKYSLSAGKDPPDSAYGFYLLHGACHNKGGMVAKRLTKLLDESSTTATATLGAGF